MLLQQKKLILNIGSGQKCLENMVNIDIRELPNVDVIADAANIDLPKGIAQGIYSSHVLEHFSHEKLRRSVLPNWVALLCNGGFFPCHSSRCRSHDGGLCKEENVLCRPEHGYFWIAGVY